MPYIEGVKGMTLNTSKQMITTLKLNRDEVLSLLDALEARHLPYLDEDELATHDRMWARLEKALNRV